MSETVLGWAATYSEASPDKGLSIQHSDVVQVALLERGALLTGSSALHVLFIEPKTAMDDQVGTDKDSTVALAGAWRWARRIWLVPCHHL